MTTPLNYYRYGDSRPVSAPFILSTPTFNQGDSMYLDTATTVTPPDGRTQAPCKPVSSYTWGSAIADPAGAPTIAAASATNVGPGFTVAGAGYKVQYTYVTADGLESGPSPVSAAMSTNTDVIVVTGVAVPAGVTGVRWYVSADGFAAGSYHLVIADDNGYGRGVTIGGPPPSGTPVPPSASGLSAKVLAQVAVARLYLGISQQTYLGFNPINEIGVNSQYATINTAGVFDFPLNSASDFNDGDFITFSSTNGTSFDSQTYEKTTNIDCAIARCVKGGTGLTTVRGQMYANKMNLPPVVPLTGDSA